MNIDAVLKHLEKAAKAITHNPYVEMSARNLDRFTRVPGVIIYPAEGVIRRDGKKVAKTPGEIHGLRFRQFNGQVEYAARFKGNDVVQLTEMLNQFLEYLFEHHLHDEQENYIEVPSGDVRFSWRNPEGVLLGEHTVELLIPAQAALYDDRERKPIDIVISYELATSLEGVNNG